MRLHPTVRGLQLTRAGLHVSLIQTRASSVGTQTQHPSNPTTQPKYPSVSAQKESTFDLTGQLKTPQVDPLPFSQIPGPKGIYRWPVIGTFLNFKPFTQYTAETLHLHLDSLADKYGSLFRIRLGKPLVITANTKDAEIILQNEGKYPYRFGTDLGLIWAKRTGLKPNMVDAQGAEWYEMRTIFNKRFKKPSSALTYLKTQNEIADEFIGILSSQNLSADGFNDLTFKYSAECIGVVCFNRRLGFLEAVPDRDNIAFLEATRVFFYCFNKASKGESRGYRYYKNQLYRDYDQAINTMRYNTRKHIQTAKASIETQRTEGTLDLDEPNLLLSLLSDNTLSLDDVITMVKTLYVAGTDSTAKNLQTFFYNLARNPDKQEKLRAEIISVLGHSGPLTAEAVSELPYLKACLRESFRLLSPTMFGLPRILPTDVVLSGYRVPAGTLIGVGSRKINQDYFLDADKFIPERWFRGSDGRRQENIPRTAYMPFGLGLRKCIGQRFAEQEIYLMTIKVMQNKLKIGVKPESLNTKFIYTIFVHPETPIKFTFAKLE